MKIRITPGALVLLFASAASGSLAFLATLVCVSLHEAGHLFAARAAHVRIRALEFDVGGAKIYTAGLFPSYKKEFAVAAAGPVASLLFAYLLRPWGSPFFTTGLSLALFNLLPIEGFDGGRLLFCTVAPLFGEGTARRLCLVATYLSLLLLFSLSAGLLLCHGENITLAALCASLFAKLFLFAAA